MASVKYKGRWVESSGLPIEIQIELGLTDEVKKKLSQIPESEKKNPVVAEKKRKTKKGVK